MYALHLSIILSIPSTLTEGILDKNESNRFIKNVQNLKNLKSGQLHQLNLEIKKSKLKRNLKKGIF